MSINTSKYPENLSWEMKAFSMPKLPRGDIGLINTLKTILLKIKNHISPFEELHFAGSDSVITLNEACIRLRPMKLVMKNQDGWVLSEEAETWLTTNDDLYLAAIFCTRIKFISEILYHLQSPKKSSELQDIAIKQYSLNWKTLSDINSRLVCLRQFELVSFEEFSLLYTLTDKGQEFLKNISITDPIIIEYSKDETINETSLEISEWAISYSKEPCDKKTSIGYILGDTKVFNTTIHDFIHLLNGGTTYDAIYKYAKENYDVAESSLRSFLTTLNNLNIIKRKTDILYDITNEAKKWIETDFILDLICIFQRHFHFIFDLLQTIEKVPMTYKELAATAKGFYGFERENTDEIRKRILILKTAKLIRNESIDRFTITERARKLLEVVQYKTTHEIKETNNIVQEPINNNGLDFYTQLRLATRDSSNFEKLEQLVKIAFEQLGFQTEWLGGAGKTDVLIHAAGASNTSFTVAVDAKSTQTGNVTDGLVDFDTLLEHKRKHNADYSAIVGGSFQNERLVNRAITHGVILFDIDSLETLIKNHTEIPIQVTLYKKLFEKPGLVDISCINDERERVKSYGQLLHSVMDCLVKERLDPVTQGILQERDIYLALRNNDNFKTTPSINEISNMLKFLSSPLIGCVEKGKDGYCAIGTLDDAIQKFEFFARMCKKSKE